jgi:hypothetical protein
MASMPQLMYEDRPDLMDVVRNAPWHLDKTKLKNFEARLFLEYLCLFGYPKVWQKMIQRKFNIDPKFTFVKGRAEFMIDNGNVGRVFDREDVMELLVDSDEHIWPEGHQDVAIRIWRPFFELRYHAMTTLLVEPCEGNCEAHDENHPRCLAPYNRFVDGVKTYFLEQTTLQNMLVAITQNSSRLTPYAHHARTFAVTAMQELVRTTQKWRDDLAARGGAAAFEHGAALEHALSLPFNALTEEPVEEGHIDSKNDADTGGSFGSEKQRNMRALKKGLKLKDYSVSVEEIRALRRKKRKWGDTNRGRWTAHRRAAGECTDGIWRRTTDVQRTEPINGREIFEESELGMAEDSISTAIKEKFGADAMDNLDSLIEPKLMGEIFIASDDNGQGKLAGEGVVFEAMTATISAMPLPKQTRVTATEFSVLGSEYAADIAGFGHAGIRVDLNCVLRDGRLAIEITDSTQAQSATPGTWKAQYQIDATNVYAVVLNDDFEFDDIEVRFVLFETTDVHHRHNKNLTTRSKWQKVLREPPITPCALLPAEVRDKVQLKLAFHGEQNCKDVRHLVEVMHNHWPGVLDDAPVDLTCCTDERLAADMRDRSWVGGTSKKCIQKVDYDHEDVACTVEMQSVRLRSAIVHSRGDDGRTLALAPCVCMRERGNQAGAGYRKNRCWACQFRTRCPNCMSECIPAQEGSVHGMGSITGVADGRLHEECNAHEKGHVMWKELDATLQFLMVQIGEYDSSWVKDVVGQYCTQIGDDRLSQ